MRRPLILARALCGDEACAQYIEPLLADWQHELESARVHGTGALWRVSLSGSVAFARTLTQCACCSGVWMPPMHASIAACFALLFALGSSIALLMLLPMPYDLPRSLAEPMEQRMILALLPMLLPPAFMLGMFLFRRDRRATWRHAMVGFAVVLVAAVSVVSQTTAAAIDRRYNSFEFQERMRERLLEVGQAGRLVYPWQSYRRTINTTVEQRRASYERGKARMAEYRRQAPPPSWNERFAAVQPVILAVVLAVIGWLLGGLGRPTLTRGLAWWALMLAATVTMSHLLSSLIRVPMPRAPALILPLFLAIAAALAWHAHRFTLKGTHV